MADKSVEKGDFYNRIGGVALLTAAFETDGALQGSLDTFAEASIYDGLNFRFHFKYYSDGKGGQKGEGSVGILGLSRDTIRAWAAAVTPDEYRERLHFVRVYAGYQSDGDLAKCELFTAWITGGVPTSPPDMWLNLDIQESAAALSNVVTASQGCFVASAFELAQSRTGRRDEVTQRHAHGGGLTVKQACESAVEALNGALGERKRPLYVLEWHISDELSVRMPNLRGVDFSAMNANEVEATINAWGIVRAHFSEVCEPRTTSRGEHDSFIIQIALIIEPNFENWDFRTNLKPPFRIDQDSGMVGIPEFGRNSDYGTVTVKSLMRRDIGIGDLIEPVSQFMEAPYKYYKVTEIAYEGEFRGQSWYVTYKGQRVDEQQSPRLQKLIKEASRKARADKIAASTSYATVGGSVTGYMQSGAVSSASQEDLDNAAADAAQKVREQWALKYGKDA